MPVYDPQYVKLSIDDGNSEEIVKAVKTYVRGLNKYLEYMFSTLEIENFSVETQSIINNVVAKSYDDAELRTMIMQLGESITLKADQATLTSVANGLQAEIDAVPGMITLSVDSIKIGSTNLILDSAQRVLVGTYQYTHVAVYSGPWLLGTEYTLSVDKIVCATQGGPTMVTVTMYDFNTSTELFRGSLSVSNSRQSWTFKTPANMPADASLLIYAGVIGSTQGNTIVYERLMLEVSNKPSAWSPAPADPAGSVLSGANIVLREGLAKIIAATTFIGVPVMDSQGNPTEQMQMQIDSDGVEARVITSPSVAARYMGPATITVNPNGGATFRSLNDAFETLCYKTLDYNVNILVDSGVTLTMTSRAVLIGVGGSGIVTVNGRDSTINGAFYIARCSAVIRLERMVINNTLYQSVADYMIHTVTNHWVLLDRIKINGNGTTVSSGVFISDATMALVTELEVNSAKDILRVQGSCIATAKNTSGTTSGGAGYQAVDGGILFLGGSRGVGNPVSTVGLIVDNSTSINPGSGAPPVPIPTTVSYTATNAGWYQTAWKSNETNMLQGYTSAGEITGAMWFDNTSLRAALSGKTITTATLRLYRRSGYGRSSSIDIKLHGITNASKSGSPNRAKNYGQIASLNLNENLTITIPVAAVNDLVSGAVNAFALYVGDGKVIPGRDYSDNYGLIAGSDGGNNAPLLTVTYQ